MTGDAVRADPADLLGRLGSHWGWVLCFGIVTLIAGLFALFLPGETLLALTIIFGVQLIVSGVFEVISALAPGRAGPGSHWFAVILGALSILVGVVALRHIFLTIIGVGLVLGLYWFIHGLMRLFAAISHRETPARGWTVLSAVLSVIAGIFVVANPGLSLLYLAIVLGVWLVIYGAIEISAGLRLRGLARRAPSAA